MTTQGSSQRTRHAVVMGLGLFGGGVAAARHLVERGWRVLVTDLREADALRASIDALQACGDAIELRLGEHREEDFERAELVVANPAVDPATPLLEAARRGGARITSELELALDLVEGRPVVLVTGTQGKTSTTTFLHSLLLGAGIPARLGGNMGRPLLEEVTSLADGEVLCVEVSSYQLEALPARARRGVRLAIVTNVLVDHLERHGTPEAYGRAKARVVSLLEPGGLALLPEAWSRGEAVSEALARGLEAGDGSEGARGHEAQGRENGTAPRRVQTHPPGPPEGTHLEAGGVRFDLESASASLGALPRFQLANLGLALEAALELGAAPEVLRAALGDLRTPAHRSELHLLGDRRIVDNGVCTTPEAALGPVAELPLGSTVLLGGRRKQGLSFEELGRLLASRGDRVHVFGADRDSVTEELQAAGAPTASHATFEDAVDAALDATPQGGTLLFSPACASFDTHRNFEERAQAFLDRVRARDAGTGG